MGVFSLLDSAPPAGQGQARRYTVRDVYMVGLLRQLTEYGVRPRYAAIAARRTVDAKCWR